jgi:hypothetical protein
MGGLYAYHQRAGDKIQDPSWTLSPVPPSGSIETSDHRNSLTGPNTPLDPQILVEQSQFDVVEGQLLYLVEVCTVWWIVFPLRWGARKGVSIRTSSSRRARRRQQLRMGQELPVHPSQT